MAADLAADLVVMVALGSDLQRVACVCRAWSDALADLPRFIYDPRGRTPMLDAARACARDYYARRMTAPFINLLRGMGGMQDRPWAIKWRLALRVPNAWRLRGHVRWLPHRPVNRMLRAVLCGLPCAIPRMPERAKSK
jgi:hypothetical protein